MRNDIFHHTPLVPIDGLSYPTLFNEPGECSGSATEITPEFALKLGYACSGIFNRISICATEHGICQLLLCAFISGAGISGAQILKNDADFYAAASYVALAFDFELTVFIENDGTKLRIHLIDKNGFPIKEDTQRKIVSNFGTNASFTITDIQVSNSIHGTKEFFASNFKQSHSSKGLAVAIRGNTSSAKVLKHTLSLCGCEIVQKEKCNLLFDISSDGLKLRIRDEKHIWHDESHISALVAYLFFSNNKKTLAIDADAPNVIEQIASDCGGRVLRIGRDKNAEETFKKQHILRNAIADAVYLCSYLSSSKEPLFSLMKKLPDFILISQEVNVKSDKHEIISHFAELKNGLYKENAESLRICADGGWINITPSRTGRALRITAESFNEEIASELCKLYVERTRHFDNT